MSIAELRSTGRHAWRASLVPATCIAMLLVYATNPSSPSSSVRFVGTTKYLNNAPAAVTHTLEDSTTHVPLSGTIASPRGSVNITEGTTDGRNVTLKVNRRANYDEIPVTYTGTIDGDVMRLSMRVGAREPIPGTARRERPGPAVPGDK